VISSTPRPHFTPGKDTVPILQEAGWASGSVWTGGKSHLHRDSILDRLARSQSLYRLSYRAHMHSLHPDVISTTIIIVFIVVVVIITIIIIIVVVVVIVVVVIVVVVVVIVVVDVIVVVFIIVVVIIIVVVLLLIVIIIIIIIIITNEAVGFFLPQEFLSDVLLYLIVSSY
jgi:hypothetical protein